MGWSKRLITTQNPKKIGNRIPSAVGLVTTASLNTKAIDIINKVFDICFENKIPDKSRLFNFL